MMHGSEAVRLAKLTGRTYILKPQGLDGFESTNPFRPEFCQQEMQQWFQREDMEYSV